MLYLRLKRRYTQSMKNSALTITTIFLLSLAYYSFGGATSAVGPTFVSGTISTDTTWVVTDSPFVVQGVLTIASGVTLTIDPGVVVKFDSPASHIIVHGNLNSNGTLSQPVTFTSINDDSVGGDTNNDGLSTGQPGQWRAIFFLSGTSILNHTNVFFRGTSHGPTILLFANLAVAGGNLTINSGRSAKSFENNIAISSGSLNIYGTEIDHAGRDGVLQTNGVTSIVNSSIHDNFRGVAVTGGTAFITQSSIQNNASLGVNKNSPSDMDTRNNFWGDSTGPFHTTNLGGLGNPVSDNVLFKPFLLTNPLVNQAPFVTGLHQLKSDGLTTINESAITTEDTVIFKATLTDPQKDQSKLQVELRQFSEPFTGIDDGGILESGFFLSGSQATIQRFGFVNGQYKWRVRAIDSQNNESPWQEFGTAGNIDFEVKLVPLYTQIESNFPSATATRIWSVLDYAKGVDGNYDCGSSIGDCGCVITSEVMLMRFYGITDDIAGDDVNPLIYNFWLTSNKGYKSNGDIKWPKINDYSKDQFGVPRVFYAGPVNSKDTNTLNGQLNNLQPTILNTKVLNTQGELVDHFIVADGKLSSTYTVKDPIFYLTKNLNQSRSSFVYNYNNNFLGLRLFSPVTIF